MDIYSFSRQIVISIKKLLGLLSDYIPESKDLILSKTKMQFQDTSYDELLEKEFNFQKHQLLKFKQHVIKEGKKFLFPEVKQLIILTDIVGFSKGDNDQQIRAIYLFQSYLVHLRMCSTHIIKGGIKINQFIPTGDGCYIMADPCEQTKAIEFLTTLITGFQSIQTGDDNKQLSLRVSALIGTCVPFVDLTAHKNYIGEGMNEASRILTGGQTVYEKELSEEHCTEKVLVKEGTKTNDYKLLSQNCLYLGDSLKDAAKDYAEKTGIQLTTFENIADKHGKTRNISVLKVL